MAIRKGSVFIVFLIIALGFLYYQYTLNPYTGPNHLPDPVQTEASNAKLITLFRNEKEIGVQPLANYSIKAAVKSIKKYSTDPSSDVSPVDFALAWGDLNKEGYEDFVSYSQSNRWYYFNVKNNDFIDVDYVYKHSANTHIIPANSEIDAQIKAIRKNDYVELTGYLVCVHFENGDWSSSLSRNDTGDGACEIMYVTQVVVP